MHRFGVALFVLALASACGGGQKPEAQSSQSASSSNAPASTWEPPPMPTDGAIAQLGLTGPDKPWESMSYDEKEWYMIGKVHPVMRQVFQTYDAAKYEGLKFECTPCHAPNAKETKYKMPNPTLSAIPPAGSEDWKAMENSRIVKFMAQRVSPAMAMLLGEKPYDPATGQGFTCYACHPKP